MRRMKIVLIAAVTLLSTTVFAQKSAKVGHINSNELLQSMPERAAIQKELETYATQLKSQIQTMQKEYETKVGEYQSKQESMTDLVKQTKVKEITDLEKRILEFQQTAEADLGKKEQELLKPVIDKAKKAIDDVAKENGYTYVLDASLGVVLYSMDTNDILPMVKKKLSIN